MPRPSAKQLANRQNGASGGQRTSQNRSIMQAAKAAVYNAWRGVYEEAEETIEMVDQGVKDGEILTHHPVQSAAAVTQDAAAAPLECECDCTKCAALADTDNDAPRLLKKYFYNKGDLRNKIPMRTELEQHDNIMLPEDATMPILRSLAEELLKKNAYRHTPLPGDGPTPAPTPPPAPPASPSPAAGAAAMEESPHCENQPPPKSRRGRNSAIVDGMRELRSPPRHDKQETRDMRTERRLPQTEDVSALLERKGVPPLPLEKCDSAVWEHAAKSLLDHYTFQYDSYRSAAEGAALVPLSRKDWKHLVLVTMHVSSSVLDNYCEEGRDCARAFHTACRASDHPLHTKYWPHYAHLNSQYYIACVDGAWVVRGYASPHGIVHATVYGLVVAVAQITKEPDPKSHLVMKDRIEADWAKASGEMDRHGTAMCVAQMAGFLQVMLARDGDVKAHAAPSMKSGATDSSCFTHALKNLKKRLASQMQSVKCIGAVCGGGPGRCKFRFKKGQAYTIAAWCYDLLRRAVYLYLPELVSIRGGTWHGPVPIDIGSECREECRQTAVRWFKAQLMIIYLHVSGDHSFCHHDALPDGHPHCNCKMQLRHLRLSLNALSVKASSLLTPFGLVHINGVESNHALMARVRAKGVQYAAAVNFLGEIIALLRTCELNLNYLGYPSLQRSRLGEAIYEHAKIDVRLSDEEEARAVDKRDRAVQEKKKRDEAEWQEKRKAHRKKTRKPQVEEEGKDGTSGSYASGGTVAALIADLEGGHAGEYGARDIVCDAAEAGAAENDPVHGHIPGSVAEVLAEDGEDDDDLDEGEFSVLAR